MATKRFKLSHNAEDYEALGDFGPGNDFIVTKFPPGASRMLGAPGTPSGVAVVAHIANVETERELRAELNIKFPDFNGFVSF